MSKLELGNSKTMKTRPSIKSRKHSTECDTTCVPPLTPLAYIAMLFIPFISIVFGNAVTFRQREYANFFQETYGKPMQPLPDTTILQNVELPSFTSRLAMRDWVNALAACWCTFMFFFWILKRNYVTFTTFMMTEAIIVPMFAISQWLTIIPDSDPECLASIDVPDGSDWIWYRISLIQCGDMMWSSAVVQVIIFSVLGFSGYKSRCIKFLGLVISIFVVLSISIIAWMALYQYSCDIILSVFVTLFVSTHPAIRRLGLIIFYRDWSREVNVFEENVGLMGDDYEEEFGIHCSDDDESDV